MQITLNPQALATIARFLECKKSLLLSGNNLYVREQAAYQAERALMLLLDGNRAATGYDAMLAEVDAEFADEDGQYAAQREALAISADILNDLQKPEKAFLAQTLNAVRLERQWDQAVTA